MERIDDCETDRLRSIIREQHGHTCRSREECIQYCVENGIEHIGISEKIVKEFPTTIFHTTKSVSFPKENSVTRTTNYETTTTFQHIQSNLRTPRTMAVAERGRRLYSLHEDETTVTNVYVDQHVHTYGQLRVANVPLYDSVLETETRVDDMKALIDSTQTELRDLRTALDVYKGAVNHQFTYLPEVSKDDVEVEILQPTNPVFMYRKEGLYQNVAIDDNIVNWFLRFRYEGQGEEHVIPSEVRIKLPYSALGEIIPIRSFVRYTANNRYGEVETFNIKPRISQIDTRESMEHIQIMHEKRTGAYACEFHINARYPMNMDQFGLHFMSPMRYDMRNSRALLPSDVSHASYVTFLGGKMQWSMLRDRINTEVNMEVWVRASPAATELQMELPYESYGRTEYGAVYYRTNDASDCIAGKVHIDATKMYVRFMENGTSTNVRLFVNLHLTYYRKTVREMELVVPKFEYTWTFYSFWMEITNLYYRNAINIDDTNDYRVQHTNDVYVYSKKDEDPHQASRSFLQNFTKLYKIEYVEELEKIVLGTHTQCNANAGSMDVRMLYVYNTSQRRLRRVVKLHAITQVKDGRRSYTERRVSVPQPRVRYLDSHVECRVMTAHGESRIKIRRKRTYMHRYVSKRQKQRATYILRQKQEMLVYTCNSSEVVTVFAKKCHGKLKELKEDEYKDVVLGCRRQH